MLTPNDLRRLGEIVGEVQEFASDTYCQWVDSNGDEVYVSTYSLRAETDAVSASAIVSLMREFNLDVRSTRPGYLCYCDTPDGSDYKDGQGDSITEAVVKAVIAANKVSVENAEGGKE